MLVARCGLALSVLFAVGGLETPVQAQQSPPARITVFAEAGGNAWLYSVNADYRVGRHVSVRAGVTAIEAAGVGLYGGPLMVSALPGWKAHRAEIGAGVLLGSLSNRSLRAYFGSAPESGQTKGMAIPTLSVGYRYQHPDGGLFVRAVYTPIIAGRGWSHWAGFGVGYTFPR
jgi:hypothetical protein